ncbi:MAG: chorismate mutase [Alphaproteobacteria bacterium]|nr:chorismate mutase [Alphaproteobacteria bacterium]
MSQNIKEIMKPFRDRIDAIDEEIIALLRKRYDVIEEVGVFKTDNGIAPVLQDRVDAVRERAATMAAEQGLDEDFIRHLYAQLIEHSCDLEDQIMTRLKSKKAS